MMISIMDTSVVISGLALLISVASAITGGLSVRIARSALATAREQFLQEGPVLEIRTMYTYGRPPNSEELIGIDAEIRNAGRTSTTITSVGIWGSEGGYDEVVSDALGVGAMRRYNFDVEEFADWIEGPVEDMRIRVETGHGEWHGDSIPPELVSDVIKAVAASRPPSELG